MSYGIPSIKVFAKVFGELKGKRNLFAFILYDERPSSKTIGKYFLDNMKWLNSLANASSMYIFIYEEVREKIPGSKHKVPITENPSLKIAHMFKIKADQLPGIVFFTLAEFKSGNGIFLPLDANLFKKNNADAEKFVSQVFSIVQKCQSDSNTTDSLSKKIRSEIKGLITEGKLKPAQKYLQKNLRAIAYIPVTFFEKLGEALGPAILGMLINGPGQNP
jgi:hypothetical protein